MEKTDTVRDFMAQGHKRDKSLRAVGLTKNLFYYKPKETKPGKRKTEITKWRDPQTKQYHLVANTEVVKEIVELKFRPGSCVLVPFNYIYYADPKPLHQP